MNWHPSRRARALGFPSVSIACLAAAIAAGDAGAATQDYILELPAGQMIAYKIEFEVPHPGRLTFEANWPGTRVVSFKLEGPNGGPPVLRRSGPPPQRLHFDVGPESAGQAGEWRISIRSLPFRDAASGMMALVLPDARPPAPRRPETPTAPPGKSPEPWLRSRPAPPSLSPEWRRLYETTERLRSQVVEHAARDRYDWQLHLVRYLAERRDAKTAMPALDTRRMLRRSADAIRRVRKLAESRDPFIVEPPADDGLHRAWLTLRERRIAPLELELDSMLHTIHKGHVPELKLEPWYGRFVSCLLACERYFEQRGRLGEEATNRDIVEEQWPRLLLAGEAMESLAEVAGPDDEE